MPLKPLTNREATDAGTGYQLPADGFYHVVPLGEYPISDGKKTFVQIMDAPAITAIANRGNADLAASPAGLLVDFDHFSGDLDKESRAAGWIEEFANREDGLYAKIRWTNCGKAAVSGGEYRFLSPVFDGNEVDDLGGGRIRPRRLLNAGLTNDPNLKTLKPLSNRNQQQETQPVNEATLKALGLAADATDEQVIKAVQDLKNRAGKADQAEADLAALKQKQLEADVEKDLDEYKDVIQNRDEMKKQLLANRSGTLATLKALKPAAPEKGKDLPNRKGGKVPDGEQTDENKAEAKQASAIRNRANVIAKEHGCSYRHAFSMAKRELEE